MIKSELITAITQKLNHIPEKDIADSLNCIITQMADILSNGGRIEIRGFGSFSLHFLPPRNAHNPKTGEKVITEAKYRPHFKPGKALRERVNANRHLPLKDDHHHNNDDDDFNGV